MHKGYKQSADHVRKRSDAQRKGAFFKCLYCGGAFWRKPYDIANGDCKYCTRKCYLTDQKGKSKGLGKQGLPGNLNPKWKGGVTSINKAIRNSREAKAWRRSVFERDDWTCQKCGNRSLKNNYLRIEAHHLKPFAKFPQFRFEISNGLTLCKKCHDQEHKGKEIYDIK